MNRTAPAPRHLSLDGFSEYLAAGAPSALKIEGEPIVYISVDPASPRLTLRTPLGKQAIPDLSGYERLSASSVYLHDRQWCELRLDGEIVEDAYPVFCSIADRIQLRAMSFGSAVVDALGSLRELLSGKGRLTQEQEIGLYGELLVLGSLLDSMPAADALASWRGPEAEEHDFTLDADDVEVKCTTCESRAHWIGGFSPVGAHRRAKTLAPIRSADDRRSIRNFPGRAHRENPLPFSRSRAGAGTGRKACAVELARRCRRIVWTTISP